MPDPDQLRPAEPPEWLREIFKDAPRPELPDFDERFRELERQIERQKEPA